MTKFEYRSPKLIELGTVAALTQVGCTNDAGDSMPGFGEQCEGGSILHTPLG